MKKGIVLFLICLLILNIFVISLTKAQDEALPPEMKKIQGIGENLTNPEIRSQYLKQEWGKILEDKKIIGPIIKSYKKISPYTDPIFKIILGITPSLTWLFVLTLTLWIAFVIYIFRIFELTSLFSKPAQYVISFGIIIIISVLGITKKLAEYIINALSKFTIWWVQLIGIGIVILALIVASILSKNIKKVGKAMKEKKEKEKEKIDRIKLSSAVEQGKKITEALSKSGF